MLYSYNLTLNLRTGKYSMIIGTGMTQFMEIFKSTDDYETAYNKKISYLDPENVSQFAALASLDALRARTNANGFIGNLEYGAFTDYMAGSDVGGFGSDTTPELLSRWFQLGAISPFFRNHYAKGTRNQEAYAFDRATMDACRAALDLRYHLLPYIYDLAHGDMPILRPLVLEFPDDPMCRNLTDQCMLGDRLLAAPVMTPGVTARAVYLPKGVWFDYYTGKRYVGGKYILADAPADRMPLFAKAGAAIPVSVGKPQCVEEIREVVLEVFPGNGRCVHHMDDGETMDYLNGRIRRIQIAVCGHRVAQKVIADGYPGPDSLSVHWMA